MLQQLQVELGQLCKDQGTAKRALYRSWMSWCLWVTRAAALDKPRAGGGLQERSPRPPRSPPRSIPVLKVLWKMTGVT